MSTYTPRAHPSALPPAAASASTTLFRRLCWEGTVPLEIRVDPKELPAGSDRGLECYYVQAPRVAYLPLVVPELKKFLTEVVFDEAIMAGKGGPSIREEEWWFEGEDGGVVKWHWPIGLIYDTHTIATSLRPSSSTIAAAPLRLTLHLVAAPTDKLLMSPSADACKQAFMGQLKEADFLRWGNTKRMTGLRKAEQDGLWDGIKEHNFDEYWRVAAKVTPTTTPARSYSPPPPSSASLHARPPSADPGSNGAQDRDRDGAYTVRSVPVRIYLPDGPVLQDLVPPVLEDGTYHTLHRCLSTHLPLLFPPDATATPLAYALVQGVLAPLDSEMGWLGACMAGADGWVNVCVGLSKDGLRF